MNTKITKNQALVIKQRRKEGSTIKSLAFSFRVSETCIEGIIYGRTDIDNLPSAEDSITDDQINDVRIFIANEKQDSWKQEEPIYVFHQTKFIDKIESDEGEAPVFYKKEKRTKQGEFYDQLRSQKALNTQYKRPFITKRAVL